MANRKCITCSRQIDAIPLLPLARLVPRLTPCFLLTIGFSASGLVVSFTPIECLSGEATLVWDPIQDANLGGYRLYYGNTKGSYEGVLDVGMETTYILTDLEEGQTYYFALVA
jgi:hypothetical protein